MNKDIIQRSAFAEALNNARNEIEKINKKSKGFNYSYADLPTVNNEIMKPLFDNQILVQGLRTMENPEFLEVRLTFIPTGEFISTYVPLLGIFAPKESSDKLTLMQRMGATTTYAMRYGICEILWVASEKDDDAASGSHTHSKPYTPPPLKPTMKGEPFSKSLPPITPKVEKPKIENDDELIAEILNLWSIKKELCMVQDPIKGTAIQKRIDDQFMGVPTENLTNMRNFLRSLKDVIKDDLDDGLDGLD